MDIQLQNSKGIGPILRLTANQRIIAFNAKSNSIYNKFSPFTGYSIGPSQPYIYTKISDSNFSKNLTKYDSQVFPIGSTARDLKRIGQYLISGNGLLYTGKQLLLQRQNAFNETRVYNPLSVLKATAKPGSLGLIDYPQRHLETSGGLLNFFKDALLSTIGFQTKDSKKPRIDGTATGIDGVAYSSYAGKQGGARAGMMRYDTAMRASTSFDTIWIASKSSKGGFLKKLGSALVARLKSLIPSTNPLGAFGGKPEHSWVFRPEYMSEDTTSGIYFKFLEDRNGYFTVSTRVYPEFYNGKYSSDSQSETKVTEFHRYTPSRKTTNGVMSTDDGSIYASITSVQQDKLGINDINFIYSKMLTSVVSPEGVRSQFLASAERYNRVEDYNPKKNSYPTYDKIPTLSKDPDAGYGSARDIAQDDVGRNGHSSIKYEYDTKLKSTAGEKPSTQGTAPQFLNSAETYNEVKDYNPNQTSYRTYDQTMDIAKNPSSAYGSTDSIRADSVGSGGNNIKDRYNQFLSDNPGNPDTAHPQFLRSAEVYGRVEDYNPKKTSYPTYGEIPELANNPDAGGYAPPSAQKSDTVGANSNNINKVYSDMLKAISSPISDVAPQSRKSAEQYNPVTDYKNKIYPSYLEIPSSNNGFEKIMQGTAGAITLTDRGFSKLYKDEYNSLPVQDSMDKLRLDKDGTQSKDLMYFYFHDIINKKYIPFRATISSVTDSNTADWEDIQYLGRADKLFLYKGFTHDVSFAFTVYASSASEMMPMWERINYLVGLTRPSKYTGTGVATGTNSVATTGRESSFIYPPMIKFRLGDLYVDQPAVLNTVSVSVPDDAVWETIRSDNYQYIASPTNIKKPGGKSRQLPLNVNIQVNLKIMEKQKSIVSDPHFGYNTALSI